MTNNVAPWVKMMQTANVRYWGGTYQPEIDEAFIGRANDAERTPIMVGVTVIAVGALDPDFKLCVTDDGRFCIIDCEGDALRIHPNKRPGMNNEEIVLTRDINAALHAWAVFTTQGVWLDEVKTATAAG